MTATSERSRPLFSDISPLTYNIALFRRRLARRVSDALRRSDFVRGRSCEDLPVKVYGHNSLIRRKLGNTDQHLQEGKARSLAIAAPYVDGIVIEPGQTFSFWRLVGAPVASRGFAPGVVISGNRAIEGIGGGLCQFTNLLHWLTLHSPLTIVEHHHHSGLDLFPDFNRQIPFGTGTSIVWNFLDYRVRNDTELTFQYRVSVDDEYLRGVLRASDYGEFKYHIREDDAYFYRTVNAAGAPEVRRHNRVLRDVRSRRTGNTTESHVLLENDALVTYDETLISGDILGAKP